VLAVDYERMTGKPEVISADPIRAITSVLPTIQDLALLCQKGLVLRNLFHTKTSIYMEV
jgi:hypothetical protein